MKPIDLTTIAPIIRGLCINTGEYPWVIIYDPAKGEIPPEALTVDIAAAITENQNFDEDVAAKVFREAHTAWEFEIAPAGVEAAVKTKTVRKEPSCVAVKNHDVIEALYWIDRDIDSARKRMHERNASLLEEKLPRPYQANRDAALRMDAVRRTAVVKNRIALVTGGPGGLGGEMVRGLAASGALVYMANPHREEAEALARSINDDEKRTAVIPLEVNVTDEASVKAMFQIVAETTGGLDICIGNTEANKPGSMLDQRLEDFNLITAVNYISFFLLAKYAGLLLRGQHRTAPNWKTDIIQINSKLGLEGEGKNGAESGGKSGSLGLIASVALELVEYNIKVNAVCPGHFFDSPLWSDPDTGLFARHFKAGRFPGAKNAAAVRSRYEAEIPMKRGCIAADVMRGIYYIIEQEYETGQALPITGGEVMLH
ncbi:MAG: SDR family NAD(P)-dependent oxidoreductase [Treponema sp.]|jgi:sorbitol-6-phosphate 2-dehydrogenase|nr:SDR family NAD(P)-dependent oxidoreductase [Treponema sp.]